jgi:thioredoxin-like negative regulator of GroEL
MTSTADSTAGSAEAIKPLLLFFYSPTDGRSRRVEGFLAQVLQRRQNHQAFRLTRIDVGERPDLAERFRVSSLPALVVVSHRRVKARLECPHGCTDIEETLEPWLRGSQSRFGYRPNGAGPPRGGRSRRPQQGTLDVDRSTG